MELSKKEDEGDLYASTISFFFYHLRQRLILFNLTFLRA